MTVEVPKKRITEYSKIAPEDVEELIELTKDLKGLKVVHVNATAYGGGVAELLYTLVPLMEDLGLNAKWEVLEAPNEFYNVTKKFHNALQGAAIDITDEEFKLYEQINMENAKKLDLDADVVIIHDPQPALIPVFKEGNYIWRCHIDTSSPDKDVWERLTQKMKGYYKKALFHLNDYINSPFDNIGIEFPPSIDPLSEKNRTLSKIELSDIINRYSIDVEKPIITVVARFDPWKDLFGAIDVYREIKKVLDVQLLIVSAMAKDDPEGWTFFEDVLRYAGTDKDILFLTDLKGVSHKEVNAIQTISTLGLHTATKEGFGLVISEMMWKGNPVVARPVGGIKLQVDDGINGYLRYDIKQLAEAAIDIIKDSEKRKTFGINAKETVRKKFLTTSHLKRYLKVISEVANETI
ncbi:glycosyltransferase [Thermosipho ferrireducens]|uniref:Glycosyltransferase n=1 Tax=Thermosipho ferrireducens TaxID=2571116 RepID=A0ABX7S5G9_9BACT|nr:glycosyltransferase [Thermosipho ferrireducens]QTA37783.1 glycosyltransferase [Thermosipho ferrireducens]